MRTPKDANARWDVLAKDGFSIASLQRAIKFNGPDSPCVAGLRSVCWKTFLLFQDAPQERWTGLLRESRGAYTSLTERYLQYIRHPELLAGLSSDPLADDPDSPWNSARMDDAIRIEILQDVQRLPDEPLYRQEAVQTLILDVLFVYCKMNPDVGGYRQGMHELLAPFVWVLHQDALEEGMRDDDDDDDDAALALDATLAEVCDAAYIEHDAFTLFSRLMAHAKPFYAVGDQTGFGPDQNTIVEKSRQIHEGALLRVDAELANHLTSVEVLPQIFLIRWIRLLFGREFPFAQLLVLWDTLFAFDPSLALIDLVCVAMLLRIRWTLLGADYSGALQLLLKYPAPEAPHGPHTFVDDALYLRGHLHAAGGANLVLKYTGRSPAPSASNESRSTGKTTPPPPPPPPNSGLLSQALRQRTLASRASLRPRSQAGGVEALFQGAARGMLERGEKLGINQAVREAVGEIRRNVQGLQVPARNRSPPALASSSASASIPPSAALMDRRNRQLSAMLDETVSSLRALATSRLEDEDKDKAIGTIELAAAKIQFIKVYLEDSSLAVPGTTEGPHAAVRRAETAASYRGGGMVTPTVALDTTEVTTTTAVEDAMAALSMPSSPPAVAAANQAAGAGAGAGPARLPPVVEASPTPKGSAPSRISTDMSQDRMDTDMDEPDEMAGSQSRAEPLAAASSTETPKRSASALGGSAPSTAPTTATPTVQRPKAPIPTRSSLAQSSFAWMLEPDTSASAGNVPFPPPPGAQQQEQQQQQQQQRSSRSQSRDGRQNSLPLSPPLSSSQSQRSRHRPNKASREKNAFLFGEVTAEGDGGIVPDGSLSADRIFGLQPIRKR